MKVIFTFVVLILTFSSFQVMAMDATHGMVIFGKEKLFAYHLPMFHEVHNKQMVITFEVPAEIKKQIVKLQDNQYLTFVPAPFDLDKFISAPFALKGDLYSGHFEKNGMIVLKGITFTNPQILFLNKIIKSVGRTQGYKSEVYKLFGNESDLYALHLINGATEIDQIFKLTYLFGNGLDESLSEPNLLKLNSEYTASSHHPGGCPSRVCGESDFKFVTLKTDSLYFEDQVY